MIILIEGAKFFQEKSTGKEETINITKKRQATFSDWPINYRHTIFYQLQKHMYIVLSVRNIHAIYFIYITLQIDIQ
jgi:hypothetical protein